jgi:hypothetical protein
MDEVVRDMIIQVRLLTSLPKCLDCRMKRGLFD